MRHFLSYSLLVILAALTLAACAAPTPAAPPPTSVLGPLPTTDTLSATEGPAATPAASATAAPTFTLGSLPAPVLLLISSANGQLGVEGDLWAWDGPGQPLKQLTNYGHNYAPVISPDGKSVAYDSTPEGSVPFVCNGWPPANIWVLQIATDSAVRVAGQPPDAVFCNEEHENEWATASAQGLRPPELKFIQRPQPTWSPDSRFLAWGEHQEGEFGGADQHSLFRLATADAGGTFSSVIVPDMPGDQAITHGQMVDWGQFGIADSSSDLHTLVVYNRQGKILFEKDDIDGAPVGPGLYDRWVTDGDKPYLYYTGGTHQYLLDPATFQQSETSGQIDLYSLTAPDGISLIMTFDTKGNPLWHVAGPGGVPGGFELTTPDFGDEPGALDVVAIAPDGRLVAYLGDNGLTLYDANGQSMPVDLGLKDDQKIQWIGWGPTGWRLRH